MEYNAWYRGQKVWLCRHTVHIPDLMMELSGVRLINSTKQDEIKETRGDNIKCEVLYDHLVRLGPGKIGQIIICLENTFNDHVANVFRGSLGTMQGLRASQPSAIPRDSVLILRLVLDDPTSCPDHVLYDPDKWSSVANRILAEADKQRIRELRANFEESVLLALDAWFGYGKDVAELLEAIREFGMHSLADRIIDERVGMSWAAAFCSRIVFNVGDEVYNFTGREEELRTLHGMLNGAHRGATHSSLANHVCITGLGAVGKSALARKYAYRNFYNGNIIWLKSDSEASLKASFSDLATKLDLEYDCGRQFVIKKLEATNKKSLLIFDNVQEIEHVKQFLSYGAGLDSWTVKPYVLLTSRRLDIAPLPNNRLILSPLSPADAVQLILNQLPKPGASNAERLAERLGSLPLALQQAISYTRATFLENENSINKFLDRLSRSERDLLDDVKFRDFVCDYTLTTFTTWDSTLFKIQGRDGGELALELIKVLSYLDPNTISIEFLKQAWPETDDTEERVKCLENFSMIGSEDNAMVSIHRLVQSVTRLKLSTAKELDIVQLEIVGNELSKRMSRLAEECIRHGLHLLAFQ